MPITTEWDKLSKERLRGICELMDQSTPNIDRLSMLYDTMEQIDHRRGTNWRALWPEIEEYFIKCGIAK